MAYDKDDIRAWHVAQQREMFKETFAPMQSLADVGTDRYDELAKRQFVMPIMDVLTDVIDGTFGMNIAEAHTTHNELYEFAEELAEAITHSDKWKQIRGRIKRKEDLLDPGES